MGVQHRILPPLRGFCIFFHFLAGGFWHFLTRATCHEMGLKEVVMVVLVVRWCGGNDGGGGAEVATLAA